jgi:hypothetical protein
MKSITRTTNHFITLLDYCMYLVETNAQDQTLNLNWFEFFEIALDLVIKIKKHNI